MNLIRDVLAMNPWRQPPSEPNQRPLLDPAILEQERLLKKKEAEEWARLVQYQERIEQIYTAYTRGKPS